VDSDSDADTDSGQLRETLYVEGRHLHDPCPLGDTWDVTKIRRAPVLVFLQLHKFVAKWLPVSIAAPQKGGGPDEKYCVQRIGLLACHGPLGL
jgi:hypothetical protein